MQHARSCKWLSRAVKSGTHQNSLSSFTEKKIEIKAWLCNILLCADNVCLSRRCILITEKCLLPFPMFVCTEFIFDIQLFRERLADNVHATTPEMYRGWSWVHCFSKKFETMAGEAMDICLWVLKESNKSRFDSYSVRTSLLIISHITFRECRVHIFSDKLSRNSWMQQATAATALRIMGWLYMQ